MIQKNMPLKYKEIQKILKDYWFILDRTNWSHSRFKKDWYWLTVAFHKEYPPKTAKSMLKDISEISGIDYKNLLKNYNIKL